MNEFFGPGGLLEQRLGDYEFRPSQIRMAEGVYQALEAQNHLVVEAGTGTGKTIAYLLPALVHGRRIIVSTGTKTLQDQIFYKDVPLLETIIGRPIAAAYLKGRNNYLCRQKMEAMASEGLFTALELPNFQAILDWSKTTQTGDRSELGEAGEDSELWSKLDARRDRCSGSKCVDFDRCFLTMMRQKAMEADIVIVNHHLFFADLAIRNADTPGILPDYSAVIFDEAHELEEIATEYFGFHVSNLRLFELVSDARRISDKSETPCDDIDPIQRASDRFFGGFALLGDGRHPIQHLEGSLEGIGALIGAIQEFRPALRKRSDFSGEWEALDRRAGEIVSDLEVFQGGFRENYVS